MTESRVYLGKIKDDFKGHISGKRIWLSKHSWDCGWYWGFGYIGNANNYTHFDSCFLDIQVYKIEEIFEKTKITQSQWWVIRDLFIQAYALKKAAAVYRHGGHQTTVPGITDIIKNDDLAATINHNLEKVLDKIWDITTNIASKPSKYNKGVV